MTAYFSLSSAAHKYSVYGKFFFERAPQHRFYFPLKSSSNIFTYFFSSQIESFLSPIFIFFFFSLFIFRFLSNALSKYHAGKVRLFMLSGFLKSLVFVVVSFAINIFLIFRCSLNLSLLLLLEPPFLYQKAVVISKRERRR
jgi:hypothetical protein